MRINPVLRNENRLDVRTPKFTAMLFAYITIISAGVLLYYNFFSKELYAAGINVSSTITLYILMAVVQAVLLMVLVPSLTATSICSEREKQTLDILLSTKLTPLQIVLGKLFAASNKVIIILICTLPIYSISTLIGGIKILNIVQLIVFFIVNTIFVGSIGVLISTYSKNSRAATTLNYAVIIGIYIGIIAVVYFLFMLRLSRGLNYNDYEVSKIIYLSPVVGFASLLSNQVGVTSFRFMFTELDISNKAEYISMAIQIVISIICIFLAARKLNPLNEKKIKVSSKNKKVKKIRKSKKAIES
ncbi:ABC transporter permease subunit [Clostridium sp.]|uniref:ABC transporter permease n=1 Tax=Clostridium sp. TaxID=1506 RepID=UPI0026036F23|nr:ABC transporter permease subunit [Clostridium sp.]